VGPILGDRSVQAPLPQLPMAPRPHGLPFAGTMGGGGGYGEFQPLGQFNAAMGTGMMPPSVAPHLNPAFLAAAGMAMRGPRVWPDEAMDGGFWGAQLPWNFKGCQLPWQRPAPTMQAQQQHAEWNFGKGRGMRGGRPGRSEEKGTGNVRRYPERRQSNSNHDGGDLYKEHDREEKSRRRERAPEKEREPERHWDEGDRRRGDKRRYQEYSEDNDDDRRVRARARSQSRNDGYDDHPRRRH
jgi:cleavage and polyadenylation specificity factor subunit 6/7